MSGLWFPFQEFLRSLFWWWWWWLAMRGVLVGVESLMEDGDHFGNFLRGPSSSLVGFLWDTDKSRGESPIPPRPPPPPPPPPVLSPRLCFRVVKGEIIEGGEETGGPHGPRLKSSIAEAPPFLWEEEWDERGLTREEKKLVRADIYRVPEVVLTMGVTILETTWLVHYPLTRLNLNPCRCHCHYPNLPTFL